jgi:hypothetical protein
VLSGPSGGPLVGTAEKLFLRSRAFELLHSTGIARVVVSHLTLPDLQKIGATAIDIWTLLSQTRSHGPLNGTSQPVRVADSRGWVPHSIAGAQLAAGPLQPKDELSRGIRPGPLGLDPSSLHVCGELRLRF